MEQDVVQLSLFDKFLAWFETNKKQAGWGIAIVAVVAFLVSFYFWRQGQREVQASEALTRATVDMGFKNGMRVESPDAYLKVVTDYPGTAAAGHALLQAAAALFEEGKYTEAQAQFERFSHEYVDSPYLPEASLGVAACLDAEGKTADAAAAYEGVAKNYAGDTVAPQAQFALARIYESQGKTEQAWLTYEKLAQMQGQNSSIGSEAGMRAEELKEKMPALSTNEAPATTAFPQLFTTNVPVAATN
jgi:predicted negative regulator of RcsB-dependent stress response